MKRRLFLFLGLLPPLLAQRSQFAQDKVRQIDQAVAAQMSCNSVPAVSVAIANGSQLRWAGGDGMADLENFTPVTPLTGIRLGSVSKPITAIAIMQPVGAAVAILFNLERACRAS